MSFTAAGSPAMVCGSSAEGSACSSSVLWDDVRFLAIFKANSDDLPVTSLLSPKQRHDFAAAVSLLSAKCGGKVFFLRALLEFVARSSNAFLVLSPCPQARSPAEIPLHTRSLPVSDAATICRQARTLQLTEFTVPRLSLNFCIAIMVCSRIMPCGTACVPFCANTSKHG